jgi:hypothetical protein
MDRIGMWLDDKTLKNLKSISRKLVSLGKPSLSEEEILAVKKIEHGRYLPSHVMRHFLANGLPPTIHSNRSV